MARQRQDEIDDHVNTANSEHPGDSATLQFSPPVRRRGEGIGSDVEWCGREPIVVHNYSFRNNGISQLWYITTLVSVITVFKPTVVLYNSTRSVIIYQLQWYMTASWNMQVSLRRAHTACSSYSCSVC